MWVYELPTTGSVSFADFVAGGDPAHIARTTTARAGLKTLLKSAKRSDGERDYLNLVKTIDEYLPWLYALIDAVEADAVTLKAQPVFSWRSTLSSHLLSSSPRVDVHTLHAELAFTLLTYAFALSDLAHATTAPLGAYEHERGTSGTQRKANDDALAGAVKLLCRAAGVFGHIAEKVIPAWDTYETKNGLKSPPRPVDLSADVLHALSRLALADAHTLALRTMFSRASAESALTPGPPLPKSHPSPGVVSKLFLHVSENYSAAFSLVRSASSASADLRRHAEREAALSAALAHKWLGVDAGEAKGGPGPRAGEAVAFLNWARDELEGLKKASLGERVQATKSGGAEKEAGAKLAKAALVREIESVGAFLKAYRQLNDTVHFQPVPQVAALKTLIPAGRSAVASKPFEPPAGEYTARHEMWLRASGRRRMVRTVPMQPVEGHNQSEGE
ncbi:hypothetical protein EXIGLDRAFT_743064 [Exidia glandulosa HHB12029]|uniref:pH-response regulator protein palC n=1 Tax=Exidia glandulosa HHB12029 TaxID=1314781 RepID=A0A165Z5Z8_EXIGL|nr:hypothetical protein EXIGLDRAFT_743064 [Exidia glandulosa HHB12029]